MGDVGGVRVGVSDGDIVRELDRELPCEIGRYVSEILSDCFI